MSVSTENGNNSQGKDLYTSLLRLEADINKYYNEMCQGPIHDMLQNRGKEYER